MKRKDQTAPRFQRRHDFPIRPEGGTNYSLVGIPPDLHATFSAATARDGRSWRNALLSLMREYATGAIVLTDTEES